MCSNCYFYLEVSVNILKVICKISDPSLPENKLYKIIKVGNHVNYSNFGQADNKYIKTCLLDNRK